ncbi:MAG: DUF389 domain-containing protein [Desulfobacca sp.]|nr:DUF389 domain-containing protein [Desulfobacca sp.]
MIKKFPGLQTWRARFAGRVARFREKRLDIKGFSWFKVSPARANQVIEEISYGSIPQPSFFTMLATATLISSFGLVANSGVIIIGAMLVCPLMTPILGMALALVRGDAGLLGRAIRAEATGIVVAIGIAVLFGSLPLALEVTSEMRANTQPNLLDLLVAVLAGFAGSFALVNARLSPALPGVAIATSIVPPLASTGLCLALGAYQGAWGSFLLFLANFLAIMLVAAAVFFFTGLAPQIEAVQKRHLLRQIGVAGIGFVVVASILTHALVRMVQNKYLTGSIRKVLAAEFSQFPGTSVDNFIHQFYTEKLYILTTIRTPEVLSPDRVKDIQGNLADRLKLPTELIVRCISAKDISAHGSTSQVVARDLDGSFLTEKLNPEVLKVQFAEQALREILETRPDLKLINVSMLYLLRGPVILATIQSSRTLISAEVQEFEQVIQDRLQDPDIRLLTRCMTTDEIDHKGRILYGWSHFGALTAEEIRLRDLIEGTVRREIDKIPEIFATNVDAAPQQGFWAVRVEAVGARVISVKDVARLEKTVSSRVGEPVQIYLWSRAEAMVTTKGYSSIEEFTRQKLKEREGTAKEKQSTIPPAASFGQ